MIVGCIICNGLSPFTTPNNERFGRANPTNGMVAVPVAAMLMYGANCATGGLLTAKTSAYCTPFNMMDSFLKYRVSVPLFQTPHPEDVPLENKVSAALPPGTGIKRTEPPAAAPDRPETTNTEGALAGM